MIDEEFDTSYPINSRSFLPLAVLLPQLGSRNQAGKFLNQYESSFFSLVSFQ